jgi:hypothetical protein
MALLSTVHPAFAQRSFFSAHHREPDRFRIAGDSREQVHVIADDGFGGHLTRCSTLDG